MKQSVRIVLVLVLLLLAPAAQARIHSLSGNARFQIGNGLPLPIGLTAVPAGRIVAVPGATIRQHGLHDPALQPARIVIDPTQLSAPAVPTNLAVFLGPVQQFQVHTAVAVQFPKSKVAFSAGGRTGAATVTFCPGSTVSAQGNPGCANPAPPASGVLRYTRTTHQFGGPASARMGGTANVALRVAASAPCAYAGGANPACQAIFAPATPPAMFGAGNAFGFSTQAAGAAPSPGRYYVTVNPLGTIVGITATGLGPGLPNPATSWGGPWTTGMLTVSQPASVPPGIFVLSGTDARVPPLGTGSISLVSGAISVRGLSGPNANRGWLNLSVGPVLSHVPVMPVAAMIALIAAIAVSGAFFLRWRARPEAADRQSDAAGGESDRR